MDADNQLPTASAHAQEDAADLQLSVQLKLGRCLIRLQHYERLLKTVIVHQEVAGSTAEQLEAHRTGRMQDVATKTLGHLVGQLTSTYITTEGMPSKDDAEPASVSLTSVFIRTTHRMEMSPEDYATTERRLRELVELRNELVHHLLERFDLSTLDGCRAASVFLDESYERVDEELARLRGWSETSDQARAHVAAILSSDDFQRVFAETMQSGHGQTLRGSAVVQLLQAAAIGHSTDGWANLAMAVASISSSAPEETPARYGCSSWRQLLDQSRQFEIRRASGVGPLIDRTWFRPRTRTVRE